MDALLGGGREGGERTYSTAQVPWRGAGGFGKWCVGRLACVPIHVEAWGRGERERESERKKFRDDPAGRLLRYSGHCVDLRDGQARRGSPGGR